MDIVGHGISFIKIDVKGVGPQRRRTTATEFVALAGNGAGRFFWVLNDEGGEIERKREIRKWFVLA